MQAPAHRPHFLLLWIGVLLVAMTGALKMLTADEQPVAAHDPARALPPSPPVPIPFAEELPMLLDEHGQPIAPKDQDARLAEAGASQPQYFESSPGTEARTTELASREAELAARSPEVEVTRQPAPHLPREFPRWQGSGGVGSSIAARDRLDPDEVRAAPPPFQFVLLPAASEVAATTETRAGARKPRSIEVWVVPVTPDELFTVVLTQDEAGQDSGREDEVTVTEEEDVEADSTSGLPGADRDQLVWIATAARERALATGRLTHRDFAEILAEAQKRAGDRSVRSFFRRFSAAEFRAFLAQVLKTAA